MGSDGRVHPDTIDAVRLVHLANGGYFYASGSAWVDVPAGWTYVTASKGLEYQPLERWVRVEGDTSLTIALSRPFHLDQESWFGGDIHVHANHGVADYQISPSQAKLMARAEGLSVIHLLDGWDHFTGAPHPFSDEISILYYSFEYRNQAYGHAALPGLRVFAGEGCCAPPGPAYPMLLDLRDDVVPTRGPMIVLSHPHTTDDYFDDEGWPGFGLGREFPVLAALGGLDAFETVSYSNNPMEDWGEWTDVVSSGIPCPPVAGTDAELNYIYSPPPGGYRVYAQQVRIPSLDYDEWITAVKAGRTFVTNYPLIPDFEVAGVRPGGMIEAADDSITASVRIRALCVLGLVSVKLIADGGEVWTGGTGGDHPKAEIDTTFSLTLATPATLCARAVGLEGHPLSILGTPLAQTNAIRFTRGGVPVRATAPAARMLDRLDDLTEFVLLRGGWNAPWERDTVLSRIGRSRQFYESVFVIPPGPFSLTEPADDETVAAGSVHLRWTQAIDPEQGDRVDYTVLIESDSSGAGNHRYPVGQSQEFTPSLRPGQMYWWGVEAADRGQNVTHSSPQRWRFYHGSLSAVDDPAAGRAAPRGIPNPAAGLVRIEGLRAPVVIFDPAGRMIAIATPGSEREDGAPLIWDGRTLDGRWAAPGLYWARGERGGAAVRLIRIP